MSYQYPPPPQDGADMDLTHAGYISSYATPSASSMEVRNRIAHPPQPPNPAQDILMPLVRRRDSVQKSSKLRRAFSTPNVRKQGANDPENGHMALSSSEKRRNKLGYHRTSVACGHCRRRKIRCILQPADPGGRCMNCIRLKKECSFFPVDQQPPTLPGQKQGTRPSVGSKIASTSSSPAMTTGQPPDAARHQLYPQLSTSQSLQHMGPPAMQNASANTYSVTHEAPGSTTGTRAYEFGHGVSEWMATDASGSSSTKSMEDLNASWRTYPQPSPVSPAFSPYTTHAVPGSATWSAVPGAVVEEAGSRAEDVPWSSYAAATTRSMPYGGSSGDSHDTYSPMTGARTFDSRRVSTTAAYAPAISATTLSGGLAAAESAVDHHAASLSAGAGPPPNYGAWSPHSYGGAYGRRNDGYGSVWYNEGTAGAQEASGGGESMHHHAGALYYGGR
ncbi:hypothetical protein PG993_000483 [Apiospora rasikravindrae]|uniref:Zn(2)-C6 fungal-type domain-containing protein n=1 Tax=Apiospora rasikravindrae TaxID=990691 RepID=A0ABR1U8N7_9PEZI